MVGTDRRPRAASGSEIERLSGALASALEHDPAFAWLIPDSSRRLARLARFFRLELWHVVLPAGAVWTVDGAAGASLELPEGAWRMPIGTQLAHAPGFLGSFGPRRPHPRART